MTERKPGPHPNLSDRAGLIIGLGAIIGTIAYYVVAAYFGGDEQAGDVITGLLAAVGSHL